ncbi:type VII secretion system-associated protein [Kitasatospora sp. GP82]|uniref:type VII secretion system-associated protein n=1 Tax=Kitasatospora sp. GP82 TaxID=3035089 RepID=UPI002475F1CA|nr:type VII secretion system-associated protein [Kitasatospora sp. GP82]MDH6127403.1 hypothetical protein [Kitasatospora sp. GP82]
MRARKRPGDRLAEHDPAFGEGPCPGYGVVGRWQIDHQGVPVRFEHNPEYLPSPRALGMPEPENAAEAALQSFVAKHLEKEALRRVLLDAPLAVRTDSEEPGLYLEANRFGAGEVSACTSLRLVPAGWQEHRVMTGRQIAEKVPGAVLALNPGHEPTAAIGLSEIRRLALD